MSDFELALLFSEYLNTANFIFSNFMALVFAMLTASFFLAHRMERWVAVLFLVLYSIGAVMTGAGVLFAFTDFAALGVHIHQTASQSADLAWLGPAGPGGAGMGLMPVMISTLLVMTYFGSLGFFLVVRRRRMDRPDAGPDEATP
ncbi:hypothetical protein [Maricaulis sp.]|uniref:hypothetical protein n=1 Tax=Maricaulis sp. TaxID=1486257 RepID=UPI0025C60C00|nr:hypothetical protein [Maricaulis sp.]